jgi:hypothetical protein
MASEVGIWNLALTPLGVNRVMDPLDETEQARKCSAIYEEVRDDELSSHPWNFAKARELCALNSTAPKFEFAYSHKKPSGALRLLEIESNELPYKIEGDNILCNINPLYVKYIRGVVDPNEMPAYFRVLVAARMTVELAFSLTNSSVFMERFMTIYTEKKKQARASDAQEGRPTAIFSDRWVDCRVGNVR